METNVLVHHGIKGQKWYVRNYQYADGTLTPKGEKRFHQLYLNKKEHKAAARVAYKDSKHNAIKADSEIRSLDKKIKKLESSNDSKSASKIKSYKKAREIMSSKSQLYHKRMADIKSGTLKAGIDYATKESYISMPYAYVFLTGPKVGTVRIKKSKAMFRNNE